MNAFVKAQRCFALARSTSFAGEREVAIARGIKIAEGAGFCLDLFDIPGRAKTERAARRPTGRAPEQYTAQGVRDVMRAYRETLAAQEAAAHARPGETVYDARRRNFETACAAARERDAEQAS